MGLLFTGLFLSPGCSSEVEKPAEEPKLPDWVSDAGVNADGSPSYANLSLKLKQGERFPLRKVIERTVTQDVPGSGAQTHQLRIELNLGMTVEEVSEQGTRFGVRYSRIVYSQKSPGDSFEYDSDRTTGELPLSIRAWAAMVGDGFSFSVGPDNQIAGVTGFKEFIDRCLSTVPKEHRTEVMLSIESSSGENGVADFVDNAIGILPADAERTPGEFWTRTRHVGRPVQMDIESTFTLMSLTEDLAVVKIAGEIIPSTTIAANVGQGPQAVRMTVRGGSTSGECTLYRESGLPRQSRVEHNIAMEVQLAGGERFNQKVHGVTTIEAFPMASGGSADSNRAIVVDPGASPARTSSSTHGSHNATGPSLGPALR